jgi:hypothetical protein
MPSWIAGSTFWNRLSPTQPQGWRGHEEPVRDRGCSADALGDRRESEPGPDWAARARRLWPDYQRWFLKEGDGRRPGYLTSRRALVDYMPELVPTWERLTDLAGGTDRAARLLSLYCPTPYLVACSQALWTHGEPWLVRRATSGPRISSHFY